MSVLGIGMDYEFALLVILFALITAAIVALAD
jgi:hypothetical protein